MPPPRQEDEMFARNRFTTRQPVTGNDRLADMAHAMGCGTLVEESRQIHPAFMVRGGDTWFVDRHAPAPLRQHG